MFNKKLIFIFICIFIFNVKYTASQPDTTNAYISKKLDAVISVSNLVDSENKLIKLIAESKANIQYMNRDSERGYLTVTLYVSSSIFEKFNSELSNLGTIYKNDITTKNNSNELENIRLELNYLYTQKKVYEDELKTIDKNQLKEIYNTLWTKIRSIDEQIFYKQKEELKLKQEVENYVITITLQEKKVVTRDETDELDFRPRGNVNMPGFGFIYFSPENPKNDLSSQKYIGGDIRYLFTKGKTYIDLGVLKSADKIKPEDKNQIKDVFIFSVGHDFYPKYMGRGKRKYFNLYSGFLAGGMLLSSENDTKFYSRIDPHIGLEILKTPYILLDTKVGYFIPISKSINRNFRGLTTNITLNFVF